MQNRDVAIRDAFLLQVSRGLARQLGKLRSCKCRGLDDLRDFSRELSIICGDEAALVPRRKRVHIGPWIRAVARRWERRFGSRRAKIRVTDAGDTCGSFDPHELESVVAELLSNALKHGAGKPVHIDVEGLPKSIRITIADQGRGLGRDPRRGQRFVRGPNQANWRGFGIGIYLTRRLVRAHGGRFRLVSPASGGTRAIVELPRSAPGTAKKKSRAE